MPRAARGHGKLGICDAEAEEAVAEKATAEKAAAKKVVVNGAADEAAADRAVIELHGGLALEPAQASLTRTALYTIHNLHTVCCIVEFTRAAGSRRQATFVVESPR